ncbi:coiled-coil domain-containing protein 24 [Trichomycterus rosablanca]|uniref:coiled-coil domain-containing protein 24 n=1 Tax=Trichomycterus rosablanca TaxID=2290929 RepID=UPI002F354D7F
MEPVQHQQCLWGLIKECVPASELSEIRTLLGDPLIDMYTEIYTEVQMWEQIWCEIHDGKVEAPRCSLADPPAVKELLRAELRLLLLTVRNEAATLGRDGDEVLSHYSPRVVKYALGAGGRDNCTTPTSRPQSSQSRSSSRLSQSSLEDEIEALRHKLNVTHIEEVVSHLKSVLTDECEALKQDVLSLQESVESEYQSQGESEFTEPTLTELKEQRRLIKKDIKVQNLMSEAAVIDKAKSSVSQISSRKTRLTSQGSITDHSAMETPSVSPVSPTPGFSNPSPSPPVAPHSNRAGLSDKPRHRLHVKIPQPTEPSSTPLYQNLDLNSSTSIHGNVEGELVSQSTFISSVNGQKPFGNSRDSKTEIARFKAGHTAGHDTATQAPLIPAPPSGQRAGSRGQRVGRRLALQQTENLLSATRTLNLAAVQSVEN